MKNKSLLFAAIGAFSLFFASCSNEDSVQQTENSIISVKNVNSDANDYVKNFYNTDFTYGAYVKTTAENGVSYSLEEIIVNGEARGYVATNANTGNFAYFADVDRKNYVINSYDASTKTSETFYNIDKLEEYPGTNQLDLIKFVTNTDLSKPKRKFWGSQYNQYDCVDGMATVYLDKYVAGVRVSHELQHDLVTGGPLKEPCGMR